MAKKIIKSRTEIRDKIEDALRLITEPVVQTLSPLGRNVLYESSDGSINQTNDGVTIAKQIHSDDPITQSVIEVVKHAALSTNAEAGDGTTTTTLLTNVLVRGGLKMLDEGVNPMKLVKEIDACGEKLLSHIKPIVIENDSQLFSIAKISANNDDVIAKDVVEIIQTVGEDGLVFIEPSNKPETILEKDTGFIVDGGLFSPEYAQNQGMLASFEDCHILICDKRIYYEEEAETILRTAIESGVKELLIVARDFIGKSINVFSANHSRNSAIKLILVKDNGAKQDGVTLKDLAVYVNAPMITEKTGKLVNNLTKNDFGTIKKVYSNPTRTVITSNVSNNKELEQRIQSLREAKEKDDKDTTVKNRLASMTNGMVTVKVGGNTLIEIREKIFRYEDAINATRSASKHGYVPGGGIALLASFVPGEHNQELLPLVRKFCEAPLRQIAKNCGLHEETILSGVTPTLGIGYDAKAGTFGEMVTLGIIDPYRVLELAIKNAISVARVILTTEWYVVIDREFNKNKKEDNE